MFLFRSGSDVESKSSVGVGTRAPRSQSELRKRGQEFPKRSGLYTVSRMAVGEWSEQENAAIVADYFGMLALELAGKPFSKAERNRAVNRHAILTP